MTILDELLLAAANAVNAEFYKLLIDARRLREQEEQQRENEQAKQLQGQRKADTRPTPTKPGTYEKY